MSHGSFARLGRLLRRPLFGTFVVPKNARVDPAVFPEEEFPIYCLKCGYLLRGLPDGPCPECGRSCYRKRTFEQTLYDVGDLAKNGDRYGLLKS